MTKEIVDHDAVFDFDIAGLPYILQKKYIGNHQKELNAMMQFASKQEIIDKIGEIKRSLKRRSTPSQEYAKTTHIAALIDTSVSFLQKNMGKLFIEGVHYYRPDNDARLVRWDVESMKMWVKGDDSNEKDQELLTKLLD